MNVDPNQAKAIFLEAVEKHDPDQWPAFLDQACAGQSELRRRVEELLQAHREAGTAAPRAAAKRPSPLGGEGPGVRGLGATVDTPTPESPGAVIGPYKLLEQIGEGGMGTVWMAQQTEPVKRLVAVKLIKAGMDSKQVLARFDAERQALALMDHPHIAKVLDAGATDFGRPYFVMDLVKGVPITRYCDEHHLTPRQRLELFIPVCQAIQHAHQKGIIHRDLKPSNVLVALYDGKPVPKVIDFGVAKAAGQSLTERTLVTGFGAIVGTLEYMSPEQAEINQLDIDTRSDIYSLGVLLYELLTGSTPFSRKDLEKAGMLEMLRVIREQEPSKPSTKLSTAEGLPTLAANRGTEPAKLTRLVRGELDWIVMKALEKDRNRRYETANGFAMDVQRYLADEPVLACPPSAAYRLRKFARRNKAALVTAALLTGALALSVVVLAVSNIWVTWERDQTAEALRRESAALGTAVENEKKAEGQRRRAEGSEAKARATVKEYLVKVTQSQLLSEPGLHELRRDLLKSALRFYEEYLKEHGEDPTLKAEAAATQFMLSRIYADLGQGQDAGKARTEAERLYTELLRADPANRPHLHGLAQCYAFGKGNLGKAIEIWERIVAAEPDNAEYRVGLANAYNQLAVEQKESATADALATHQKALAIRERLVRENPDNVDYRNDLGATLNNLGVLLSRKQPAAALVMYRRAVEHLEFAFERSPHITVHGRFLATGYNNVASTHWKLDQRDEAVAWERKVVTHVRRLFHDNPALPEYRSLLCRAYFTLSAHLNQVGDKSEAATYARLGRELINQLPTRKPDELYYLARVRAQYAGLIGEGKAALSPEEASERQREADLVMKTLQQAVSAGLKQASWLANQPDFVILRDRADFKELTARLEEAARAEQLAKAAAKGTPAAKLKAQQEALAIRQKHADGKNIQSQIDLAANLHAVGLLQAELGKKAEAEASLRQALAIREALVKSNPTDPRHLADLATTQIALGNLDWKAGRYTEGAALWEAGLNQFDLAVGKAPEDKVLLLQAASQAGAVADSYAEAGLWDFTARHLTRVFERQTPNYQVEVWRVHACLRLLEGDTQGYRKQCGRMLERFHKSSRPEDWLCLATTWLLAPEDPGQVRRWVELQEKFAAAEPKLTWSAFYVGFAYYRAGRYEDAVNRLESVKDWPMSWPVLALTHQRLGKTDEARTWLAKAKDALEKALQGNAADSRLTDPLAALRSGRWDKPQFLLFLREATALIEGPATGDPWMSLLNARAYARLGHRDKAARHFQVAGDAAPDDPVIRLARGKLFAQFGWDDDALADFGKTIELTPKAPQPWITRGRFYAERGDHKKADADFTRAAALTPEELNRFVQEGWWVVGPYPADLKFPCPPESDPDPSKPAAAFVSLPPLSLGSPVAGLGLLSGLAASQLDWKPVTADQNGMVQRPQSASEGKLAGASVYGLTYVYSPDRRPVTLLVGGDHMRVWLNGRLVHESTRAGYWEPDMDRVPVTLQPGRNTLLVRSSRPSGPGYYFRVRVADTPLDRGLELVGLGLWKEAAAAFAKGFRRQPPDGYWHWSVYASTLLAAGDEDGYRRHCVEMLQRFGGFTDGRGTSDLSRDLCLGSQPVADPARLVQLAEQALVNEPKASWRHAYLALAEYRAGRYQAAVTRLTENPSGGFAKCILALAYHGLGQGEKARDALASADQWSQRAIESACAQDSLKFKEVEGNVRVQVLRREAHLLIHGQPPPEEAWQVRHRALVYARLGQPEKAEAAFAAALDARPDDPQLWTARGKFYAERGEHKKADADFARSAWVTPDDWHDLIESGSLPAEQVAVWTFDKGTEGWSAYQHSKVNLSDGALTVESTGPDPVLAVSLNAPAGSKVLTIRAKVSDEGQGQVLWHTAEDGGFVEARSQRFSVKPSGQSWTEYKVFFTATSRLTGLRLDLPDHKPGTRWIIDSVTLGHAGTEQLEKALQAKSDDARLWIARGRYFAWRGEPKKADADFAKAGSLTPDELNKFVEAGWWVVGPYPSDMKALCPPETDPDPSKPVAAASGSGHLHWQRAPTTAFGRVELHSLFKAPKDISAYALTYVYSPDERTATLLVGGGDRVRVWLNGQPVHETKQETVWGLKLDRVPVTLRAGRNTLLARVSNVSGQPGRPFLFLRLADSPLERGMALAELGLWEEAAAAWRQLSPREREADVWLWAKYAALLLGAGDKTAYQEQCMKMQEHHRNWSWSGTPYNIARACALAPDGIKISNRLVELAERGQQPSERYRIGVLGWAYYRADKFDECIRRLTEIQDLYDPSNQLFIAMAHHRLGHSDEARKWLTQVEEAYAQATQQAVKAPTFSFLLWRWHWPNCVEFMILRREAKALIEGAAPKEDANLEAIQAKARQFLKGLDRKTAAYDWALALQQDQPRLWLARGRRLAELKRWKEADGDLARAIELKADDPQRWVERGRVYAELGKAEQAAADFIMALELLGHTKDPKAPFFADRDGVDDELVLWTDVFSLVAERRPKDSLLWTARFRRFAQEGQWKQAIGALERVKELAPGRPRSWLYEAILRLELGDVEGYRRACREALEKFGQREDPGWASEIVRACLLREPVADLQAVVQLAERAVTGTESRPAYREFVLTRALADYRSGDHARALDRVAHLSPKPGGDITDAGAYLVQALSNQGLGRADAARQALAHADVILKRFPKSGRGQRVSGNWFACFSCRILHSEAKALIENNQKPTQKK